jgi:translation initiation factor eIF-2B subunit delta
LKSQHLNEILNNKKLGSSELVNLLNDYFLTIKNKMPEISKGIKQAKTKLGHFEVANNYLNELNSILGKKDKAKLINFLSEYTNQEIKKSEIIFEKIYPHLKNLKSVITLSRSGTVLEILKLWYQKKKGINVVVCESRPMLEGRLMAEELAANGIKVELITDAMMGIFIEKVDSAIIGADVVLRNGNVVNKLGSKALAVLCKKYKKPFYVVTTKSKVSRKKTFKLEKQSPKEVWDKKAKNLSVSNIYFEKIERKLITKIFAD